MKIKCMLLAGLFLLTSCGGNDPETGETASRENEYQMLDYRLAQTYWDEPVWSSHSGTKTIPGYYNPENTIEVRVIGGWSFGEGSDFCRSAEYAARRDDNKQVDFIIGGKELKSVALDYYFDFNTNFTFGYNATIRLYGEGFEINSPDSSNSEMSILDWESLSRDDLANGRSYFESWSKGSDKLPYKYFRFTLRCNSNCEDDICHCEFIMHYIRLQWAA